MAAAAQPVIYALSLAAIDPNNIINYKSRSGLKIHETATKALPIEFDLDCGNLRVFLEHLEARAIEMNWVNTLFRVTHNATQYEILNQYGLIPKIAYQAHATNYSHANTRQTQDSANLYSCLKKSLTTKAHKDLMAEKDTYVVPPPPGSPLLPFHDGILFLKLIIDQATIVTNASISVIVGKLMRLEDYMTEYNSDIKNFNTFVNNELRNFRANCQTEFDPQVLYQQLVKA